MTYQPNEQGMIPEEEQLSRTILYRGGYKYQLVSTYKNRVDIFPEEPIITEFINLSIDGLLTIKKYYAWDGPSGPTIDTKTFMRGSLVHDALYQLMRWGYLDARWREQADKELRKACLEDGMWKIRAWYVYRSVRRLAGWAADPDNKKLIMFAPEEIKGNDS